MRRALDGSHTGHARSDGGSGHDRAHYRAAPLHALRVRGLSGLVGADYSKAVSRHEILCSLEDVIRESANVLVAGGRMYMVHRPYRLGDIICLMKQYKMSPRRLCMVHPKASQEANLVLIEGIRGGNTQIRVEAPLVLFDEDGQESKQIKIIHGRL